MSWRSPLLKLAVVAPPTLDFIGGACRAGGPAVYAGGVFAGLGGTVTAVGPFGYLTGAVVRVEEELGVRRAGYPVPGPGLVFELEYRGPVRTATPLTEPVALDPQVVLEYLDAHAYFDAVLLDPVYGEDWGGLQPLLSRYARLSGVDVQGYVRVGLDPVALRGSAQLAHGSRGELSGGTMALLTVVTDGPGRITLIESRGPVATVNPVRGMLRDPTGAGDAYTAALLHHILEGYTLGDSLVYASETVVSRLPLIHEAAGRVECGWLEAWFKRSIFNR